MRSLRDDRIRLQGLLQYAEDAIISVDKNQTIRLFNPAAVRILGYSEEEILGQPLKVLMPAYLGELHAHRVHEFTKSPDLGRWMGERQEITGLRKDGSTFPAKASISKFSLQSGEKVLTAVLRDITADKHMLELQENIVDSRKIQLHFFPESLPEVRSIDLAVANIPSQGISGDYYDFIQTVEGHWGVVIGDIAGKGISAGLMMATFRRVDSELRGAQYSCLSPCSDVSSTAVANAEALERPSAANRLHGVFPKSRNRNPSRSIFLPGS